MAWLVITGLFLGALGAWMAISPRSLFWRTAAWQYRNPEANEPSDAAYALRRAVGVPL
jgi:hypothetical protein